jgi:hypothetical protein
MMQTAISLARPYNGIYLPYFIPLAIGQIKGIGVGKLPIPTHPFEWDYLVWGMGQRSQQVVDPTDLAQEIYDATKLQTSEVVRQIQRDSASHAVKVIADDLPNRQQPYRLGTTFTLPELLGMVGRFSNPKIQTE